MYPKFKMLLDYLFALLLLFLFSPLLIIISLLIKISSKGPIFFIQKRLGIGGSIFEIYKFRTMIHNAPDIRNIDGTTFNSSNDNRVTKFGKFLRESSLDELPQLFNILKFEMSFVGPRPELPESIETHTEFEYKRLLVKPGITGLAQVKGRNMIDIRKRRKIDVEYQQRHNFVLDLKIIFHTILLIVSRKTIYTK
jgi:undecaprenyl phosphate N,N'-diacetylbacillosamine 1-phosphate transferase